MVRKHLSLIGFVVVLSLNLTACDFGLEQVVQPDLAAATDDAVGEAEVFYRAILDGDVDTANLFPQVVWVNKKCTGTLVGKRFVLTAGHCVAEKVPVEPGDPQCTSSHKKSAASADDEAVVYFLTDAGQLPGISAEVMAHPQYVDCLNWTGSGDNVVSHKADIALLKLSAAPPAGISYAGLADEQTVKGTPCTLVGFGKSSCTGSLDGKRRFGENVVSSTSWEWLHVVTGAFDTITWKGDSGGPLFVGDGLGGFIVAGVTSTGSNLDQDGCPQKATYDSVWHHRDWILEQMSAPDVAPPVPVAPQAGATLSAGPTHFQWAMTAPAFRGCVQVCTPDEATCLLDPNFGVSLIQAEPGIDEYVVELPAGAWKWRAGAIADDGLYEDATWVFSAWQTVMAEEGDGPDISPTVWVSPTSGVQGTVFEEGGYGFTPNGNALLYFQKPDGTWYDLPVEKPVEADGTYLHTWDSSSAPLLGTYHYRAVDEVTGKESNTVSFLLTAEQVAPGCGDGACNGTENCSTCPGDCGGCPQDPCADMKPGDCTPFTVNLPPGTNATTIEWWPATGGALESTPVTFAGGIWQSPKGACAATVLYQGRWESWIDGTFPNGAPVGSCTIQCGGLGTVEFCELPAGQAAWGCAHDAACKNKVGTNLITNSDFSELGDDLSDWPGWQAWSDPSVPSEKKLQCAYDLSVGTPTKPSAKCWFDGPAMTDWHVQFSHAQAPVYAGKKYAAKYCLRGSIPGQLAHVIVQHTYSGQNVGLWKTVPLLPGQWVCETKTFSATHTFADAKITVWLGETAGGPVWIDQVELREL